MPDRRSGALPLSEVEQVQQDDIVLPGGCPGDQLHIEVEAGQQDDLAIPV
jgi:hypothetical protein